jgi:NAD+ synthase (glutamine-hydrolysing)
MKLRAALAQTNTTLGNVEANLAKHMDMIARAREQGAGLLVFPELSLTGYLLQDLASQVAICPSPEHPVFKPLLEASRSLDLVVGFVEEDSRSRFYISDAYLSKGEVVHIHRKLFLPTYGMFDEKRFFSAGDRLRAFDTRFGRLGMLICEDFWHISPPYLLWMDGADVLILTSAQPGHGVSSSSRLASSMAVDQLIQTYAGLFTTFILYTNRVGFEDGICFPGGAAAVDPNGRILVQAEDFNESVTLVELDLDQVRRTRTRLPVLRDERPELVQRELTRILNGGEHD